MGSRMRMVFPYPKGRSFQNENEVTFKISKEFKLKDKVRNQKSAKTTPCLGQLSMLLTCLKENGFMEKECISELKDFQDCFQLASKSTSDDGIDSGNPPAVEKMDAEEINKMFAKYKK